MAARRIGRPLLCTPDSRNLESMTAPFSFNVHNWIVRETARHESVIRDSICKGPGKHIFKRQKQGETSERDCAAARTPSQAAFLAPQNTRRECMPRNLLILSRLQNICVSSINGLI